MNELMTGWLSPDCMFYRCGYMQHAQMANAINNVIYDGELGGNIEEELHTRGWLSIHYGKVFNHGYYFGFKFLTRKQIELLTPIYERERDSVEDTAHALIEWALYDYASHLKFIKKEYPECIPYMENKK